MVALSSGLYPVISAGCCGLMLCRSAMSTCDSLFILLLLLSSYSITHPFNTERKSAVEESPDSAERIASMLYAQCHCTFKRENVTAETRQHERDKSWWTQHMQNLCHRARTHLIGAHSPESLANEVTPLFYKPPVNHKCQPVAHPTFFIICPLGPSPSLEWETPKKIYNF